MLPLSRVVDVRINVSSMPNELPSFDKSLIVGTSDVIDLEDRLILVTSPSELIETGFTVLSEEYLAAAIYFGASSKPKFLFVGRWDSTNETLEEAVLDCIAKNTEWYICMPLTTVTSELENLPQVIESSQQPHMLMLDSKDKTFIADLQAKKYHRTWSSYTLINKYESVGFCGLAMGLVSRLNNSAFVLNLKELVGMVAEDFSVSQANELDGINANYYAKFSGKFDLTQLGRMADGVYFDEVLYLDMMKSDVTVEAVNFLKSLKKLPQTNAGIAKVQTNLISTISRYVGIGFLAPGQWDGEDILTLQTGDTLPDGFKVMAEDITALSKTDRANRHLVPFYIACKGAGAVNDLLIEINFDR